MQIPPAPRPEPNLPEATHAVRGTLARRRAERLRRFAEGTSPVPILIHPDPDPDAVASAVGIRALLARSVENSPIVTLGAAARADNLRMLQLLRIRVTQVPPDELYRFERLISVDSQPRELDRDRLGRFAVIDHHPREGGKEAEIEDIRPRYAACATIVTEYLRAWDERLVGRRLATALLYGIKTDSDNLTRGVTPADVRAYAFLQSRANVELIRRMERPMYSLALLHRYGHALTAVGVDNAIAATFAGGLAEGDAHMLSELADLCLSLEGVCWAVAGGVVGDELVLGIRHLGTELQEAAAGGARPGLATGLPEHAPPHGGAGELARRLAGEHGQGGGHATMARASWPRTAADQRLFAPSLEQAAQLLLRRVREELNTMRGKGTAAYSS